MGLRSGDLRARWCTELWRYLEQCIRLVDDVTDGDRLGGWQLIHNGLQVAREHAERLDHHVARRLDEVQRARDESVEQPERSEWLP